MNDQLLRILENSQNGDYFFCVSFCVFIWSTLTLEDFEPDRCTEEVKAIAKFEDEV